MRARLKTCLNAVSGLVLCLLAVPALALGLGQIEVKSRPGEPLLAEIPIISSDPSELQGLSARLAPPETFRRIGLEPPQGLVSGLRFEPALDAAGKPVIRVTSTAPVEQPALTFLLEVDWGQGRLVREYVAQVQGPDSLPAQVVAPVQAPATTPEGLIERPAVATPTDAEREPPAAETATADATQAPPADAAPVAPSPAQAAPAVMPTPQPQPAPTASGDYAVQRGDTLSEIARDLPGTNGYTLDQAMLALLATNPDAFIDGNINRLRAGAVLRVPSQDELSRHGVAQAAGIVREQVAEWRASRQPPAQPVAATADAGGDGGAEPRVADARLEIAPPRASQGAQAGTQSGASAGGEGEMLRQELQETKESLAARDAEVAELKARVAELEQLQKQQQDLIALKDDALASAQQRLAQPGAAQPAATDPAAASMAASPLWWILPAALLLGGLAWWVARRRRVATAAPVAKVNTRVSDAFAASKAGKDTGKSREAGGKPEPAPPTPQWVGKQQPAAAPSVAPAAAPASGKPTWVSDATASAETIAPLNQAPAGRDRIELARAYVELGDRATARTLLQEVIDGGDPNASEEAQRALQQLG